MPPRSTNGPFSSAKTSRDRLASPCRWSQSANSHSKVAPSRCGSSLSSATDSTRTDERSLLREDLESLALFPRQPAIGFLITHDLFLGRVPLELATQADRDIGQMAGCHRAVM